MPRIVSLAALTLALTGAPFVAHAETASALVARLAADGCMPIVAGGDFKPSQAPAGGVVMTDAQKKTLGMHQTSQAWVYAGSDDKVVLEVGREGCNVFSQASGDESYLKALEQRISAKHPRMYVESDMASGGDKLRWRNYVVPLAVDATAKGEAQALSVTYSTAETKPDGRMFFVGVLASQQRQ